MKVYAIRHKGTNNYMPANPPSKNRTSYSNTEPEPNGGKYGPRIFPSHKSALNSIVAWKLGAWVWVRYDYAPEGPEEWYHEPKKVPHRELMDMEVVEFELTETGSSVHRGLEVENT